MTVKKCLSKTRMAPPSLSLFPKFLFQVKHFQFLQAFFMCQKGLFQYIQNVFQMVSICYRPQIELRESIELDIVLGLSRKQNKNRTSRMYMCRHIYVWKLRSIKIWILQAGDPRELLLTSSSPKAGQLEAHEENDVSVQWCFWSSRGCFSQQRLGLTNHCSSSSFQSGKLFVPFKSLIDQMTSTCIREANLLYLVYSFNNNAIQKHPHRHTQYNIWPNIWSPWPVQIDT